MKSSKHSKDSLLDFLEHTSILEESAQDSSDALIELSEVKNSLPTVQNILDTIKQQTNALDESLLLEDPDLLNIDEFLVQESPEQSNVENLPKLLPKGPLPETSMPQKKKPEKKKKKEQSQAVKMIENILESFTYISENRTIMVHALVSNLQSLNGSVHDKWLEKSVQRSIKYLHPGELGPLLSYLDRLPFSKKYAFHILQLLLSAVTPGEGVGGYKIMPRFDCMKFTIGLLRKLSHQDNRYMIPILGQDQLAVLIDRLVWMNIISYPGLPDYCRIIEDAQTEWILEQTEPLLPAVANYLRTVSKFTSLAITFEFQSELKAETDLYISILAKIRTHFLSSYRLKEWKIFLQGIISKFPSRRTAFENWEHVQTNDATSDWYKRIPQLMQQYQQFMEKGKKKRSLSPPKLAGLIQPVSKKNKVCTVHAN